MFLDKLWLRIKGELLTLKEDLSAADDLRETARSLLGRLETALGSVDPERETEESQSRTRRSGESEGEIAPSELQSLRENEREWEDLRKRRDKAQHHETDQDPASPNPRRLG